MSDCQLEGDNTQEVSEIDHTDLLSENIGSLLLQDQCSDLTILVQRSRFPVHRIVLASRSEYFRALLFGGMKESQDREIELKSSNSEAFGHLLKYIYTGKVSLLDLKEDTILDLLSLANQYAFIKLQSAISDKLKVSLSVNNVCSIFDASHLYSMEVLFNTCILFIDRNAIDVLHSNAFYTLSEPSLNKLLARDSFCAPEVDIFKAVNLWAEFNNKNNNSNHNNNNNNHIKSKLTIFDLKDSNIDSVNESYPSENAGVRNENSVSNNYIDDEKIACSHEDDNNENVDDSKIEDSIKNNGKIDGVSNVNVTPVCNLIEIKCQNTNNNSNNVDDTNKYQGITETKTNLKVHEANDKISDENKYDASTRDSSPIDNTTPEDSCKLEEDLGIKGLIRLPLISLEDLLNTVRPANFISPDQILDAIKMQHEIKKNDLPYRGSMLPMENVACARHNAKVIQGDMNTNLLDINPTSSSNYFHPVDQGCTIHAIDDPTSAGIVVELGSAFIINNIVMFLWDRDIRSYSYYIEVSMDNKEWVRVVDMSNMLCRSRQVLRFPQRVVKYIKIVGTHSTVNRFFHIISFECFFNPIPCKLFNAFIVPEKNVASIEGNAYVVEGVSRSRNALINGNTTDYDWDSGYTCHQLGSGSIVIQLAQPYVIGSMRLLLWDCDNRTYSYYIEVSNDQSTWTKIADRTKEACVSWQIITFNPMLITFIRIMGTHNTANEVFHCVHFECPVEESLLNKYKQQQRQQDLLQSNNFSPQPTSSSSSSSRLLNLSSAQRNSNGPRFQGLQTYDILPDSDGYGVGFLGGGGSMPSNN